MFLYNACQMIMLFIHHNVYVCVKLINEPSATFSIQK
jgi:hypothetical protein